MADVKPLIFNPAVGTPEVLQQTDTLALQAPVRFGAGVGFNNQPPTTPPAISGDYFHSLGDLITALATVGLVIDQRNSGWLTPSSNLQLLGGIGPYEPGRLIIGGVAGWQQLDMPAVVPGVIQVPTAHAGRPETNPITRLTVNQLAYSPILSYGNAAPSASNAQAGALWFDALNSQLMVFDGTGWVPVLQGMLASLAGLSGSGSGVISLQAGVPSLIGTGSVGESLVSTNTAGATAWVRFLHTGANAPWGNGASANGSAPVNGNRPAGITDALWASTARNAESLGFWDEADRRWKTVYVDSPILNGLAELRSTLADGDLFTVAGGRVVRLGAGAAGSSLTSTGSAAVWSQRLVRQALAPSTGADGDLWIASGTGVVSVREGNNWVALVDQGRYGDINGSSSNLRPGVPVFHSGTNWQLADGRNAANTPQVLGVVQQPAAPGQSVIVATDGVVVATAAEWYAVIDGADGLPVNSGLSPGVSYYLSGTAAGVISRTPGPGKVLVGTALDATHLLLQVGQQLGRNTAQVHVGTTAPLNAGVDELWFDPSTSQLAVAQLVRGVISWSVVSGGTTGTGGTGGGGAGAASGVVLSDIEAIDWVTDPKAAAIRFLKSDGTQESIRIKGTGGAVVTMSDDHTLCIDAQLPAGGGLFVIDGGRFSP